METIGILQFVTDIDNLQGGNTKSLVVLPPEKGTGDYITLTMIDDLIAHLIDNLEASEITITFGPRFARFSDKNKRDLLTIWLKAFSQGANYILIPEYGANYNLHFHGIIYHGKASIYTNIKRLLKRDIGRNTIRMIRFPETYKRYLRKERTPSNIEDLIKLFIFNI